MLTSLTAYRRASRALKRHFNALGVAGALAYVYARLSRSHPVLKKSVPGIPYPLLLRAGTTDLSVFAQVFSEHHYDFPTITSPAVIIDAGGNIGLASVFFAQRYPGARILALEPEPSNFALLARNTAPYGQITPLPLALWYRNGSIRLIDPGAGHHGFRTTEDSSPGRDVEAITLDALLARMGICYVDLLKVDIEGSEREVFTHSTSWIRQIGAIMIELHDEVRQGCTEAFRQATGDFPFRASRGETHLVQRPAPPGGRRPAPG